MSLGTGDLRNKSMPDKNIIKLQKETYLKMIKNSIGIKLFNSLFVKFKNSGKIIDILDNGIYSCAFFVSSILALLKYLDSPHTTVKSTREALIKKKWKRIRKGPIQLGDVLIWEEITFPDGTKNQHIGFALNKKQAVSTSYKKRKVVKHHITFNNKRKIIEIFRFKENL